MCDTQGQTLFRMKLKFWSRTNTFHGLSATNEEEIIFTVKSDSQVTKLVLSFKNPTDGRETEISLQDHGVSGTLLYKNTVRASSRLSRADVLTENLLIGRVPSGFCRRQPCYRLPHPQTAYLVSRRRGERSRRRAETQHLILRVCCSWSRCDTPRGAVYMHGRD